MSLLTNKNISLLMRRQSYKGCVQSSNSFLNSVYCNYVTILHRFQDITTSTEYVTACVTEKSFSIDNKNINIIHMYAF